MPPPSSGPNAEATHYRKLAESKGKRLQCRRILCQEAFFLLFQVALGKAPGCTRYAVCTVCEMTIERYSAFKKLGFLDQQTAVFSFFLKYSFRRAMLQLEFRESKSKPEEFHFEQSPRHRRYATCTCTVLWVVTMYGHLPLTCTKLGFLAVQLWPIFLLKYSLRRARLQLEFR